MFEALISLISTLIGAYVGYKLGQRSTRQAEERAAREEDLDLQLYAEIVRETADGHVARPEIGSDYFKRILRLHERGLLERLPGNYFCIPGAKILLDVSPKPKSPATQEEDTAARQRI